MLYIEQKRMEEIELKLNKKTVTLLLLLFLFINGIIYFITQLNSAQRVELALNDSLKTLKTHYQIILHTQDIMAKTTYDSIIKDKVILDIISKAYKSNNRQRDILRKELQKYLYEKYERAKIQNILQYHFVFPNNIVFLRMHKPSKFGDDLTDVREDFVYVNKIKKPIRGFTQGRTSHAFRNTFPIFDINNSHIGAVEISFSSDSIQEYLTRLSHIHTHFLVNKNIFNTKAWSRDDLIIKYTQSSENKEYMLAITNNHSKKICIDELKNKIKPVKENILNMMKSKNDFSIHTKYKDKTYIVSFLAIKNIQNQTVAWFVSYSKNKFIDFTLKAKILIESIFLLLSLILIYFITWQIVSKQNQKKILKLKIDKALQENLNQLKVLQQQSKMASMGEMIGAIAHQWRQPLNELGLSIQNLKYDYQFGQVDEKFIDEFIEYNKRTIMFMSRTIDDFRNFFRVDKEKKDFNVKETTESVISMLSAQLKNYNITFNIIGDEFIYRGFASEYSQVVLNIINNAKDISIENSIKNPTIDIILEENIITIKDNAGGIPDDIIDRVFEPYFTTKEQGQGTGMGLYMSKMIIEDNMGGILSVKNDENGAIFTINLKDSDE